MTGTRILIVDDDAIVREALAIALEGHGFEVLALTDLDPASIVEAAHAASPEVVLLDFHLGAGDSRALIGPLLAATDATVLLLTSSNDPEVLGTSLEAGAAGTLQKRQPMQDLLDSIVLAAAGHVVQRPQERDDLIAEARARQGERERLLAPFLGLSPREASVLDGLVEGLSAEQIAERDFVSLPTVRTQVQAVLRKLGVTSQLAAVAEVRRAGWRLGS